MRLGDTLDDAIAAAVPPGTSAVPGGDGLFVVGLEFGPGVHRTAGPAGRERVCGPAETSTHDLAQYTSVKGPVTITVGPGVRAVQVRGCKPWVRLGDTLDDAIAAAVPPGTSAVPGGDGLFVVGLEFGPGCTGLPGRLAGAVCGPAEVDEHA